MRGRLRVSKKQRRRQEVPLPVLLVALKNNPNKESTDWFWAQMDKYTGPTVYVVPDSWKRVIDKT